MEMHESKKEEHPPCYHGHGSLFMDEMITPFVWERKYQISTVRYCPVLSGIVRYCPVLSGTVRSVRSENGQLGAL